MMRVCVVGSINNDLTFAVERLPPPGATVLASSLVYAPGGKGANQAIAAARAGAQVQFVGAVGDDPAAAALLTNLRANGVGTEAVSTVPGPSGTAVVIVDAAAENVIVVAPGANSHLTVGSENARRRIKESDVMLMQLEVPLSAVLDAARLARQSGAMVMLNASPIPGAVALLDEIAQLVDVVVVNEDEAAHWRWRVPHLVITRGSRGASYIGTERSFDIPAPAVDAVDASGAGDVFAGVLAASWDAASWGDEPDRAVRRACTAAALATLVPGAGNCAPTETAIASAAIEGSR
ncbi:ribokinase [Mycolicibacterium sp.]|uniref:ribokinase n=1 Tax=Mycolicibacterium sp. TaxID=2320850 RepID=UPI001A3090AA|nr:ribokinase [Mycolicibacterium sp.]MBJ7401575.1 ribokinase [Mycolicibacterium sp.]